jgi:hypothetical protein
MLTASESLKLMKSKLSMLTLTIGSNYFLNAKYRSIHTKVSFSKYATLCENG